MVSLLFGVALLAGLVVTPIVVRAAITLKIFDTPSGGRRVHTRPVPRLGGVAVFVSMAASLLIVTSLGNELLGLTQEQFRFFTGILIGGGILFGTGLLDDLRDLRPAWKLAAQLLASVVVYSAGFRIETLSFLPGAPIHLGGLLAFGLTAFWIVGVTNAFNLIDGLDGLATGIALVALGATVVAGVTLGNLGAVFASVALIGALLGFLRYNFSPASIFLGDSGSMFVGFMLAVLSVRGAQEAGSGLLVVVPLFALSLPLLDTALAILRRWLRGVPLTGADARHIHHRFVALGFSHRRAALVMYGISAALAALGLAIAFAPPATLTTLSIVGATGLVGFLLFALHRLDYHEFTVAGSVLRSAFMGGRRLIRNQIQAYDISQIVDGSGSLPQLQTLLEESASHFGFLGMELCPETAASPEVLRRCNGRGARAWKIDFPVRPRASAEDEPLVLRIWCPLIAAGATLHAERVAQLLALPIEDALERFQAADTVAEPLKVVGMDVITPVRGERTRDRVAPLSPALAQMPDEQPRRPSLLGRVAGASR